MFGSKIAQAFSTSAFSLLVALSYAHADTVTGTLQNNPFTGAVSILTKDTNHLLSVAGNNDLVACLRNLRSGDQITAQGSLSSDGKSLNIDSIDRIGLQELLGTWRSTRWEIFEFQNFNQLNLYIPTAQGDGSNVSLSRTHSLSYAVMPEQGAQFSIFMTDATGDVKMGFIAFSLNRVDLTVTDFHTGQVTENISLSPLGLQ